MIVTVDGKTGGIYRGVMDWVEADDTPGFHETATDVMVNLNFPWLAPRVAEFADGVGSVRIENMVIETGKHPHLLLKEGKLAGVIEMGLREVLEASTLNPSSSGPSISPRMNSHISGAPSKPVRGTPSSGYGP